jgi:Ulp1 family protease
MGAHHGVEHVQRWQQHLRMGDFDVLLVPINYVKEHWAGAAIWPKRKEVAYFDSLGRPHHTICGNLARWFVTRVGAESRSASSEEARARELVAWRCVDGRNAYYMPQQRGGDDCGVHLILAFNYIAQGLEKHLNFTHNHIANARRVIALDIAASTLSS